MRKTIRLSLVAACGFAAACSTSPIEMGQPMPDAGTPPQGDALTFHLTPFTLQPGEETVLCQYVPPDGKERWLGGFATQMNAGSHHLVVMRITDTKGIPASGPTKCSQLDTPGGFDGFLPGAQQRMTDVSLPDGVAMKLAANHGLYFQQHYINATTSPITSDVTWTARVVDPAKVQQTAGMVFYYNPTTDVKAMSTGSATETIASPRDMRFVTATGHMHMHGLTFDATVAGKSVYHTDNWDEPNGSYFPSPGFGVKKGDPITWTCQYKNNTSMDISNGNSAVKNEMCIFVALFYPAVDSCTDFGYPGIPGNCPN